MIAVPESLRSRAAGACAVEWGAGLLHAWAASRDLMSFGYQSRRPSCGCPAWDGAVEGYARSAFDAMSKMCQG